MRSGIVISGAAHVAFMLALVLGMSGPKPFASPAEDALVVEVMTPEEVAAETAARATAENPDQRVPAEPGTAPAGTPSPSDASQSELRPSPAVAAPSSDGMTEAMERLTQPPATDATGFRAAAPPAETEPAQTGPVHAAPAEPSRTEPLEVEAAEAEAAEPGSAKGAAASADTTEQESQFGMSDLVRLYTLRLPGFDAQASTTARLTQEEVGVFRQNLRKCWQQPSGVAPDSHTRVVMRVALRPDGGLAGEPTLIEATASPEGPAVYRAALRALQACQPHRSLPRERYDEWKLLDIGFSSRDMAGG